MTRDPLVPRLRQVGAGGGQKNQGGLWSTLYIHSSRYNGIANEITIRIAD